MTNEVLEQFPQETRDGIQFYGKFVTGEDGRREAVELYIEGQEEPIHTQSSIPFLADLNIVDELFQDYIRKGKVGDYGNVVDSAKREVLQNAWRERVDGTPWYSRTHRFLPVVENTLGDQYFIFTTDKSDLLPEYQVANEDPRAYKKLLKHRKMEEERKFKAEKRGIRRQEELRREYSSEIEEVAISAIRNNEVPSSLVNKLNAVGLIGTTTTFRRSLCPDESSILRYSFVKDGIQYSGFVGLNDDLELASVDERSPKESRRYLKESTPN